MSNGKRREIAAEHMKGSGDGAGRVPGPAFPWVTLTYANRPYPTLRNTERPTTGQQASHNGSSAAYTLTSLHKFKKGGTPMLTISSTASTTSISGALRPPRHRHNSRLWVN